MKKYVFHFCILALMGCATVPTESTEQKAPPTLTVVAMNDWHGALYEMADPAKPGWAYGGLPWLVAAMDAIREESDAVLLVDAGDSFQGTWPVNSSEGMAAVRAFTLLGVDATTVGNHEFDYGPGKGNGHPLRGALYRAAKAAPYAWLTANVYHKTPEGGVGKLWKPEGITPWTLIQKGEFKVAVVGLSTQETPSTTRATHVADLAFEDPVVALRSLLPEIRAAGADAIVVTGHLTGSCQPKGYLEEAEECLPDGEIGRLLTELPRGTIDVLIVGHEHTMLRHRIGDTFVLEGRHKGHALNSVTLRMGTDGVDPDRSTLNPVFPIHHKSTDPGCSDTPFPLTPQMLGGRSLTPSKEAIELIQSEEKNSGSLCEKIGCSDGTYTTVGTHASHLGALVAKAMKHAMPQADVAITNAGGLRANLNSGVIRREDIHNVMPFDNKLLLAEMTGENLALLFRIGTSGAHGMLQMTGATTRVNPESTRTSDLNADGKSEKWETNRLCSVRVAGEKIRSKSLYKIVTTDFLLAGGDHLGLAFETTKILQEGPPLRQVIADYLQAQEKCLPTPQGESPTPNTVSMEQCRVK